MEKKIYTEPEVEVIHFDTEDVIVTSGPETGENDTDILPGTGWLSWTRQ